MDRQQLDRWVRGYEAAWRAPDTAVLADLFAADATYLTGPYDEPWRGLDEIRRRWEAERDGPDEAFTMSSEIVAVEGATGVVRVEVKYGNPVREYRDLWIVTVDAAGRATVFEEWPFAPRR